MYRTSRAQVRVDAEEHGPDRRFEVQIQRTDPGFVGSLAVYDPKRSETSRREIAGETCGEVVSVVGLMIALAIDPHAVTSEAPISTRPSPPPPPRNPSKPPMQTEPRPLPTSATAVHPTEGGSGRSFRIGMNASALAMGRPTPAWGGSVDAHFSWVTGTWFAPSIRVSLWAATASRDRLTPPDPVTGKEGVARFFWAVARLEACPLRITLGSQLLAVPCAGVDEGILWARATAVPEAQKPVRPWTTVGGFGHLLWAVGPHVELALSMGIVVAPAPDTFVLKTTSADVYAVPQVGGVSELGVTYAF